MFETEEELDLFLFDFGVPCTAGSAPRLTLFIGILDVNAELVSAGGRDTVSNMYALMIKSSVVRAAGIKYGTAIVADGVQYIVREVMPPDDGALSVINMSKV